MESEDRTCPECGGSGRLGSCLELFHTLLALDHQRLQPWGRYHGLNVACFGLQHPAGCSESVLDGQWQLVDVFLASGLEAVNAQEAELVRANRRGGRTPAPRRPTLPSDPPAVTIEDVAVDGTFPAAGYPERMHAWAAAISPPDRGSRSSSRKRGAPD